nr:retrovirus-related Pol polyprotein from transposon TNT 1-94 [Tanacetum cinerariifolium]
MFLTSFPLSYENYVETLLYGKQSLIIEDVLVTLNSKELKKRTKGIKEVTGDGLCVRGRSDHSSKAHSGRSLRFKSKGSDSFNDEGNAYFGEALVVVGNDEMPDGNEFRWVLSYDAKMDFFYDCKGFDGGSVQLVLRSSLISLGALEKKGYTVKIQIEALDIRQMGEEAAISGMEMVYKLDSQSPVSRSSPSRLRTHTRKVKESLNMTFDETPPPSKTSPLVDDDLYEEEAIKVTKKKNLENDIEDETLEIDEIVNIKESRNHPLENVMGNLNQRTLRSQSQN